VSVAPVKSGVQFLLSQSGGGHDYKAPTTWRLQFFRNRWFPDRFPVYAFEESFAGKRHLTIGNDVWLGWGCKLINAVTIGHGAVVGAFAVVREDVPPYAVVLGDPARVVKYRFSEQQIAHLLRIQW
jgi:virginiamycin A acetyltransferase